MLRLGFVSLPLAAATGPTRHAAVCVRAHVKQLQATAVAQLDFSEFIDFFFFFCTLQSVDIMAKAVCGDIMAKAVCGATMCSIFFNFFFESRHPCHFCSR